MRDRVILVLILIWYAVLIVVAVERGGSTSGAERVRPPWDVR